MSWAHLLVAAAGIASMKTAMERGDVDEASRQGVLAGPAVVESALGSTDRSTVLAGIASAPHVEDRAELLEPLAALAKGPDRRLAIPAARAAAQIARELTQHDPTDDISDADVVAWRDRWSEIAIDRTRWIEVRVLAVDVAAYLERSRSAGASGASGAGASGAGASGAGASGAGASGAGASGASGSVATFDLTHADGVGVPWSVALADPDPAFRITVLAHVPSPTPAAMREPLAKVVVSDLDPHVALAATAALCADLAFDPPAPILAALGAPGIARVHSIVTTAGASNGALREAARCLAADKSPASAAALRAIRNRVR